MISPNDSDSLPTVPRHVAIIMDGNGRWAKKRGKLRVFGHRAGIKAVRNTVSFSVKHNIESLTLYAFSSENWNRPQQEVSSLMELFVFALDNEVKNLHKHNVKLSVIGDISRFSSRLQERIRRSVELTSGNTGLQLNIAANYGGRWDLVQSVKQIADKIKANELAPEEITEATIDDFINLSQQSDVDLVIRTGGEHRISNFLIWQIAYAELYFTDILWPDFDETAFEGAINAFAKRERRFGGTIPDDAEVGS
ncbi:Undecaprenyl pyrophosphate synthase [Xenorhabdus nematophila F1]|uniref:Ditrans,polycis-undecaprenyl-diphosphate synthase ((2E,6E)-farnesyl-diphosphate specific) n=2 Tax=Xenorhabdus nematophila TaxID=628 RepID=D3VCJ1_XENNA|nr:(2E,6E)-farnesyl-diphosphate-specific ditrans,polycis-undecaprenyl-diphosphate synthase [Xenorhabdus nematophila]CBJ92026.1 undecaprenyl pyrophosphate synthetase (di-trans,poly-cis-decaprenylcistransferase) [Xenorhabdus nematophila ATCC 19061]CCW31606.1 Undecaprenyl pyrophosphate synthase [Xenorhabdus nematophila F1]CEE90743.1 undecaprenyl pyrophosphate synthetase (di-trans,poly-cis-decaprenylcistransferase) [Xenorhabdus nematophila str. Anatoliense]CEF28907.1 undecaprenyl pyrophosphate synt